MKRVIIVSGVGAIVGGIIMFSIGVLGASSGPQVVESTIGTGSSAESIRDILSDAEWYEGAIIVDGTRHSLQYRKFVPPIKIDSRWRWPECTDVSPANTVLAMYSVVMRGAPQEAYYDLHVDPDKSRDRTDRIARLQKLPSFRDLMDGSREGLRGALVLGEIYAGEYALVVSKLPDDTSNTPFYTGTSVVKVGDRYLLDPDAKRRSVILQKLSADNYSLVTGASR